MKPVFLLGMIFFLIKTLDFIYLFQIKEYRFDRFFSMVKELGFFNILFLRNIQFPAKKLRNSLIVIPLLLLNLCIFFLSEPNSIAVIFLFAFFPVMSFLLVSLMVFLTGILSNIYRNSLINEAKRRVSESKATFIGVTGSYGKTSVKEYLSQILLTKYIVSKTEANMNSDIGIALSVIKNLKKNTQYFITEMGAYKNGEIERACDIVKPKIAIITNIGNQHLSLFGSKKNLIQAKKELLLAVPEEGRVYINADILNDVIDELTTSLSCKNIVYYSQTKKADYYISKTDSRNNTFFITHNKKNYLFATNLRGKHNLENLMVAVALSYDLGIDMDTISKTISKIRPIKGRLSVHKGINNSQIINDSNNSNVEGFIAAMDAFRKDCFQQKIIVSKGIIELGQEKDASYEKIVNALGANYILFTTDSRFLKNYDKRINLFDNEEKMLSRIKALATGKTLVIIEGKFTPNFIRSLII